MKSCPALVSLVLSSKGPQQQPSSGVDEDEGALPLERAGFAAFWKKSRCKNPSFLINFKVALGSLPPPYQPLHCQ